MELKVIDKAKTGKRKAYRNEFDEVFLDCSNCGQPKALESYINSPKGFYGKDSKCYECRRKKYFKYEKLLGKVILLGQISLTVEEVTERGRRKLTDNQGNIYLDCTKCKKIKADKDFRDRKGFIGNKDSHCILCCIEKGRTFRKENEEHYKEYNRQYREENKDCLNCLAKVRYYKNWNHIRNKQREYRKKDPERYREHSRNWARENSEYQVQLTRKRRAKIRRLPFDLTTEQRDQLLAGGCCLTGDKENIHLDHVIPLNIGHGGTTHGNMIALRGDLNNSKVDNNIFEWAKFKHKQFNFTMERFNEIMTEIAERNGLSLEEYKKYVYWCFDNPREVNNGQPTNTELKKQMFFQRLDKAIEMYIRGESYKKIREETKIVSNTLLRYLRERDIPTRKSLDKD
ncbi:hypothetical protein L1999_09325 [Neobacillus drentensis]|uniref:hypothetical protein n=1 Tax=Neobacillus drentensis TaxID=220684 RepID=UPI001F3A7E08|nr:hypothetical protein [Neobacillus drentensis]ULT58705.1 hypothetical protein L1999_09325 [Neobacillus drentensis]